MPILDDLHQRLFDLRPRHPGQTAMRTAIDYILDRWSSCTGYFGNGEYPFDPMLVLGRIAPMASRLYRSLTDIAHGLGFHDRQHLTRLFTRESGTVPAEYRQ